MDKKLKTKWVKALRSGKFKQWREGALVSETGEDGKKAYCCLGVLRCVANPKDTRSSSGWGTYLNERQLRAFGMSDEQQHELAQLNDDGKSFKTIAKHVEKHL